MREMTRKPSDEPLMAIIRINLSFKISYLFLNTGTGTMDSNCIHSFSLNLKFFKKLRCYKIFAVFE